ncbi:hypothetical protein GOP47_0009058 [Adiantum capillus-veneris]|uniref:MULE transposase domain-containing protein n=1 Tax=Adiantum capillus-veneris TaxID=13818 RepID=A0A9D4UZQ4_ADICA|nr:hypothetical protein GOP47_0009058 [Adiantum capillus-veneris]
MQIHRRIMLPCLQLFLLVLNLNLLMCFVQRFKNKQSSLMWSLGMLSVIDPDIPLYARQRDACGACMRLWSLVDLGVWSRHFMMSTLVVVLHNLETRKPLLNGLQQRYVEKLQDHPMYRPKELMADLRREVGVSISYKIAWKAKQLALGIIHGDHAKSYGKLQSYCDKLVASNPGTMAHLQKTTEGRFFRMFLAFGACITGFTHCRDFIGLDGTFLTSKYLGALLTATGIDAMGGLFPIAFGVVDAENEDNWVWFLQNVHDCMASVNAITFVSDKQKGLLPAVELVFLGCEHAYCMRHLDANLKKKCNNGEFIRLFWVATYANTMSDYDTAIQGMRVISPATTDYLLTTSPPFHWATTHFKGKRYGHFTSNIAESLNAWLLEARDKPIISMLDIIRRQLTAWFYARGMEGKKACESLGDRAQFALVANVEKNLREVGNSARQYRILPSSDMVFEILTSTKTCVVDVCTRSCSCNKWQTFEIPCANASAAILLKRECVQWYVHKAYALQAYCNTYSGVISPIVDASEDASDQLKPPATWAS